MPHVSHENLIDELRDRIRALHEEDEIALQQLLVLDKRRRDVEQQRARIKSAIYSFEKMLHDEEQR